MGVLAGWCEKEWSNTEFKVFLARFPMNTNGHPWPWNIAFFLFYYICTNSSPVSKRHMLASTLSHTFHSCVHKDNAAVFSSIYRTPLNTLTERKEKTIRGEPQSLVRVHHIQFQHAAHLCNNWHEMVKCLIESWFSPCGCWWEWFDAYLPACGSSTVLYCDKIYIFGYIMFSVFAKEIKWH